MATLKKKRGPGQGRPPLPASRRRDVKLATMVTPADAVKIRAAARRLKMTVSDYLLHRALR